MVTGYFPPWSTVLDASTRLDGDHRRDYGWLGIHSPTSRRSGDYLMKTPS
jgi:hypothetical protein